MSVVATATGAVSTQQHRATQEQIRLAQLIEDKKHDQPAVQEIVRRVLDVVTDSNQEDALVALFDCDYDFEKTVALLIEKGHGVASEWRTATNHKPNKKQQKGASTKNGHGDTDENGQQRGNDGPTSRGRSRGGRARLQQNGSDSQNVTNQQTNENFHPHQKQRGGSTYRGRYRGSHRGTHRGTDRNHQNVQDSNFDASVPSDTNRRGRGGTASTDAAAVTSSSQHGQDLWDVGNWNGETIIYSRTNKDEEQPTIVKESTEGNNQEKSKTSFDLDEAARQIKNSIGIGQKAQPVVVSEQIQKSKATAPPISTKLTPPPRIPQQPVVFTDHFDGGVNTIDVQFGNLGEPYEETPSSSSSSAFYQQSQSMPSNKISQRTTEQSAHISPSPRPAEPPVISQQQQPRILPAQMQQQPTISVKQVVPPQYPVHQQQQHPINPQNILFQSLMYHSPQQPDTVALDASYDPTFSLPSIDFSTTYFMPATLNQPPPQQQQPAQPRYLVSQAAQLAQQTTSKTSQPSSVSTTAKKAPAIPPGIFPTAAPINPAAYSTPYGVHQQTTAANYSAAYENEHLFTNTLMPLANAQQTQSPSATYGSVTPPVQQQNQQQTNNSNENKALNYPQPVTENLMLLQQYALQQSNSQQQGPQTPTHTPAQLSYFLGHGPAGPSYSAGHPIMYAQPTAAMSQHQQIPKQQGHQYNQNNSSAGIGANDPYYKRTGPSTNKEGQYMYSGPTQPQHVQTQSAGQQQTMNKQQRTTGNAYNNQQRSFQ